MQLADITIDLTSHFIILKECEMLEQKVNNIPGLRIDPAFSQLLVTQMEKVRKKMDIALAENENDRKHLNNVSATSARNWFEKEIEKGWKK